jgi:hypothetical protein
MDLITYSFKCTNPDCGKMVEGLAGSLVLAWGAPGGRVRCACGKEYTLLQTPILNPPESTLTSDTLA